MDAVDIALYIALREEAELVLGTLGRGFVAHELPNVAVTCYRGSQRTATGTDVEILLVPPGKMGNVLSSAVVATVLATFRPANIVVLGIAGSLDADLQPGDVLVPDSVHQYLANSAAVAVRGSPQWRLQTSGNRYNTDRRLLNRAQNLPTTHPDVFKRWRRAAQARFRGVLTPPVEAKLREKKVSLRSRVDAHIGDDRVLASGPTVGKSRAFSEWIRKEVDRKAVAVEMESAGVYSAAELLVSSRRAIAIRGISDFADGRKNAIEKESAGRFRHAAVLNAVGFFRAAVEADVFAAEADRHPAQRPPSDEAVPNESWGTALPPNNLPALSTPIVGRGEALEDCRRRILGADDRLVTLYGPPGVGKTRLALEVARSVVDEFDDHVYLVDLTTVTDPDLVITTITRALRITAGEPLLDSLREVFRDQRALLLLDNFEHVQLAAANVAQLLTRVAALRILVTSLDRLHVEFEHPLVVDPLGTVEAKQLFRQRLGPQGDDSFDDASLSSICAMLDGVPLAVELVAAWARDSSPQELIELLEAPGAFLDLKHKRPDILPKQRSVRAAIAWSYSLLEPHEQALFRRLSVFAGGWTPTTASLVINDTSSRVELFQATGALADRWLVRPVQGDDTGRKHMLPALHEFAESELAEVEPELALELRKRHARCFLGLAERSHHETDLRLAEYLATIEREQENINAAHTWFVEQTDTASALALVVAVGPFWWSREYVGSESRISAALALPCVDEVRAHRVRALLLAGRLSIRLHRLAEARRRFDEARQLAVDLADPYLEADALADSALVPMESAQFDEAAALLGRALAINLERHDARALGDVYDSLGVVATGVGDYGLAVRHLHESLAWYGPDDEANRAWVENDLARVAIASNRWPDASLHANRAHDIGARLNDPGLIAWSRNYLGLIASRNGALAEAREHHDDSLATEIVLGDRRPQLLALEGFAVLAAVRGDWVTFRKLEGATWAHRESAAIARTAADTAILQPWFDCEPQDRANELVAARNAGLVMNLEDAIALARSG